VVATRAKLPGVPDALRCRACGHTVDGVVVQFCEVCWGPLELVRPPVQVERRTISAGPASMWRYGPLLPVTGDDAVGWTALRPAPVLADDLGLGELWLKDEGTNPTGSFKDRVVSVALAKARQLGRSVAACASTGNLARAVAAGAARWGLGSVVLVPDSLDDGALGAIAVHGGTVVRVRGGYDAVNRLSVEAAMAFPGWAWLNVDLRPWYVEGGTTVGYEIAEQLAWQAPDHVVAPMASGAFALHVRRAFADLADAALIERRAVRLSVAQPAGCAPVAEAFERGDDDVRPVRPDTVAESVAMGDPPDGPDVLAAVRASGGAVVAVAEEAIGAAVAQLDRIEGLTVEPAGGVVVAGLAALRDRGVLDDGQRVVACLTGGPPPRVVASAAGATTIDPTLEALVEALPPGLVEQGSQ
jgi:threonine synthase